MLNLKNAVSCSEQFNVRSRGVSNWSNVRSRGGLLEKLRGKWLNSKTVFSRLFFQKTFKFSD